MPIVSHYPSPHASPDGATATIHRTLHLLIERLGCSAAPPDGLLTARVIGEFSAGKTRLLRELLGEQIPPALFPVSSLERQTRLPLEITYGDPAILELIERANDYDPATVIKPLDAFPQREQLADYDPQRYRLRLAIPELRLFLPTGDHYGEDDQAPKRLLLIDMPGWNSGDDKIAEGDAADMLAGYHNLALVFVVNATRLDGQDNHERLRDFLNALVDADFVGQPTLLVVITHCPPADAERLRARMHKHIMSLWAELDQDLASLQLQLLTVDFPVLTADERATFRETFWRHLLAPIQQTSAAVPMPPWIVAMRHWSGDANPCSHLPQAAECIARARALLERACQNGDFLPGMNMHRLLGLDAKGIHTRLLETWRRQLKYADLEQLAHYLAVPASLADEHPLAPWWNDYWQANLERLLMPTRRFMVLAERVLCEVQPDTEDLRAHLAARLTNPHRQAMQALDCSFSCLVETAQMLLENTQPPQAIATLLSLSLMEARYADHYAWAMDDFL
ncbi:dynamin family protein [Thiorhodospira sibirica]|uniref:dynamin family protein n=1 Tax=Thiorhodospira sibirica TaxID=154347 RepID=UPI00022C4CAC|nr:dynamin family protein [Thiorhodospira sibirica]